MQVSWWVENIEENNEDHNLSFMLFVTDNGQCDSDHSKGAKQKYEPFIKCTLICAGVQNAQQKNFRKNNNPQNLKSTVII